jgi:hypothetical protein
VQQERRLSDLATCVRDELPQPVVVRLARFAPFLALPTS